MIDSREIIFMFYFWYVKKSAKFLKFDLKNQ